MELGKKQTFLNKYGVDNYSKTKEGREKISKRNIERILSGRHKTRGNSGHFYSAKNGKDVHYRSSFELAAYQILEQLSKVQSYEEEPFAIPYFIGEVKHRYIPDILVTYDDGSKELIEVKPEYLVKDEKVQLKNMAAEIYCKENDIDKFSIWTEKEIFLINN